MSLGPMIIVRVNIEKPVAYVQVPPSAGYLTVFGDVMRCGPLAGAAPAAIATVGDTIATARSAEHAP